MAWTEASVLIIGPSIHLSSERLVLTVSGFWHRDGKAGYVPSKGPTSNGMSSTI